MSAVEERLAAIGLELPPDWAPRGRFLPFRRDGSTIYLSGQICEWAGRVTHTGPVASTEEGLSAGQEAAKVCALNLLYRLREACGGELDQVDCVLRLGGFVNCQPGFADTPRVIDGATDVFIAAFGKDGWHARTAVGVRGLPGNASVEVDAVVKLRD
ncbi:RidA family protein [Ahrensia sp. R2A130]|uniref:RidA family protein n=1 Tax=Ahrensia sp. R2A130 TaxID=744979 RepID=UPI0001E0E836|nr:RidA family protein [Ahrensia sp. R2A130]EFL90914.1 endoribonuclease L-PSP [Ahrensia sp. R2A130]